MLSLKQITKLGLEEAQGIELKARGGDQDAARVFVLYAMWRRINQQPKYSRQSKTAVFYAVAPKVNVRWQTI